MKKLFLYFILFLSSATAFAQDEEPMTALDSLKKTIDDSVTYEQKLNSISPLRLGDVLKQMSDFSSAKQDSFHYELVPASRSINGHSLTNDISITKSDIGLGDVQNVDAVPKTTTINGYPLSDNISLTKGDIGLWDVPNFSETDTARWSAKPDKADSNVVFSTPTLVQAYKDAAIATANSYTNSAVAGVASLSYQGIAVASTNPGSHVAKRLWVAATGSTATTYSNFGITLPANRLFVLSDNGTTYDTLGLNIGLINYYSKGINDRAWIDTATRTKYTQNGRVTSSGSFQASGSYRAIRLLPVQDWDTVYITGYRDPGVAKAVRFYSDSSETVVGSQTDINISSPYEYWVPKPSGANYVSINIVQGSGQTNSSDTIIVGRYKYNYQIANGNNNYAVRKILPNSNAPYPITDNNVATKKYVDSNALRNADLFVTPYWLHDSVQVFPNYYYNASGVLTYEEGALSGIVPAFTSQALYIQGWSKLNANADTAFFTSAVYLNSSKGLIAATGFLNGSTNPRIFASGNAAWRYMGITLWRPSMANYFRRDSLIIRNDATDSIWIAGGNTGIIYKGKKFNTTRNNVRDFGTVRPIVKSVIKANLDKQRNDAACLERTAADTIICISTRFGNDGGDHDSSVLGLSKFINNKWQFIKEYPVYTNDTLNNVSAESNGQFKVLHNGEIVLYSCSQRGNDTNSVNRAIIVKHSRDNGNTFPDSLVRFMTIYNRQAPSQGKPVYIRRADGTETDSLLVCTYQILDGSSSTNATGFSRLWLTTDGGYTHTLLVDSIMDASGPPSSAISSFEPGAYQVGNADSFVYYYRTNTSGLRARLFTNHFQTKSAAFTLGNGANSTSHVIATNYITAGLRRVYLLVSNRVYRLSTDHTYERKYLALSTSLDGINFTQQPIYISRYNGSVGGFEPHQYTDEKTDKLHVLWSTYVTPPWADLNDSVFDMNDIMGQIR